MTGATAQGGERRRVVVTGAAGLVGQNLIPHLKQFGYSLVAIDMPFVRMSPVPRKQGERTRKETYLMDYDNSAKLRIELYYNDADPEAGVQGVDTAIVYTSAPGMYTNNVDASNFVSQSGSVQTNDAVLSLKDYRNLNSVTGLRRRQSGTASLHCLFVGAVCPTTDGEVSKAYTYEGDTIVSSD